MWNEWVWIQRAAREGDQMSRQWIMVLMLALAVAGCGRRGPLEPPVSAAAAQAERPADNKSVTGGSDMALTPSKAHKPPPIQPGNGSFILDPLL